MNNLFETACLLLGRFLLGLYFILPGIQKITNYEMMTQYMSKHSVPFIELMLPLTIVLQIILGIAIVIGFKGKIAAFLLAGLTLVISIYMHNFWNLPEGGNVQHETQNFFKNMGIMAGLLVLFARGSGQLSVDSRLAKHHKVE
ncbi:DoxX family protein [Ningiella sp. W23]|uniref:DoxX family protein n=1 Tax=Ningiella sp. W23 TaxID=3023715 RepID=UPI0037564694